LNSSLLFFFTDFGAEGLYTGQMEAVIRQQLPHASVISLLNNAPRGDPRRSAYLLAALSRQLPEGCVVLAVVDPGVGGERNAVALRADGRWYVGPDNGLLNGVAVQARAAEWRIIDWRPKRLSSSFHGRDVFAPIAARIALGDFGWAHHTSSSPDLTGWTCDLPEIIYLDHFGNALSGLRHTADLDARVLTVNGIPISRATTFCSVPAGEPLWYVNSIGLVEIAVNQGRTDVLLGPNLLGAVLHFSDRKQSSSR
jgi:S-adenosylmethionine hydrolase